MCSYIDELNSDDGDIVEDIIRTSFNDEAGTEIAESLVMNSLLKILDLSYNSNVSSAGWIGFFNVLLHSQCSLEELYLSNNTFMNDDTTAVLGNLLCDKSSIDSMYSSNHTLHTIQTMDEYIVGNWA